jgi:cytochrome d ubiquinol oxidase subunit I
LLAPCLAQAAFHRDLHGATRHADLPFWILAANSWMQTPAGYEIRDGVFHAKDWLQVIFNPSFPYRLVHMTLAAFITTCFVIGGISAT